MLAHSKFDGHVSDLSELRSTVYVEGMTSGMIGAAAIGLWFLILDGIQGRPFFTPNLLGTVLSRGGAAVPDPNALRISFETVVWFTWVHTLAFVVIGVAAARLLRLADRNPNAGMGIILLFAVFGFVVVGLSMVFAEQVLRELTVPAVLIGNLLAATGMVWYFRRRHRGLRMRP